MRHYLGVDIGGTNIAFGVFDENKCLCFKHSISTDASRSYEEIILDICKNIVFVIKKAKLSLDDIENIGISCPGSIDKKNCIVKAAHSLRWYDKNIGFDINKHINKSVFIANDADCAAKGEVLNGCATDYENIVLLTIGTGIGSGIIKNGEIASDSRGESFELGHLILVHDGVVCACKNKGCLQTYASATALCRIARENITKNSLLYELCNGDENQIDGKLIFKAVAAKDAQAINALNIYLDYLSSACYTAIMAHRPDALVIGGGISIQEKLLIKPLKGLVAEKLMHMGDIYKTPILSASLLNDAGIMGACFLTE